MHTSTPCAMTAQSPRRTGGSAAWHAREWCGALLLLLVATLWWANTAVAQIITTVAGNGSRTTTLFGGQATATSIGQGEMKGLVVDTVGNFYFTDGTGPEIRKVDTSGVVSVFAGAAQGLMRPWGLGIDAANNVYAADLNAHRVWRITPAGVATSVAGTGVATTMPLGGLATATNIGLPYAVAVDSLGNLFILQSGILKVTAATGMITSFSSTCGSQLAITTDAANNVYRVCNQFNQVEKFAPGGGVPTRIAGLASGVLTPDNGDGGLATNAALYWAFGVAVDSASNVYISTNSRIRKVDAAGIITTLGGTTAGYGGDGGLAPQAQLNQGGHVAVDSAGNVFFLDLNNNRVRKITVTVPPAPTIASIEGMNGQLAVRLATPVVDGGSAITSHTATCGAQSTTSAVWPIIVSGLTNGTTVSCTVRATNALGQGPVSASVSGTPYQPLIHTIAGTGTGGFSGDGGQGNLAQVNQTTGVVADAAGNLYLADIGNNRIRRITPSGVISTIVGTGTAGFSGDGGQALSAQINQPHGVAIDTAGNLYIASHADHRIRKVSSTGVISTIAGTGTAGGLGDGGQATSAQLNTPVSVDVDPAGNVYVAERGNNKVRRIDTNGVITTYAGTGVATYTGDNIAAASSGINYPGAVRFHSGFLYIADFGNHRVRRVDSAGIISTYAGSGVLGFSGDGGQAVSAQFHAPYGLSFHPNGDLYVGTAGDYRIRKITPAGIVSTVAGDGTNIGGANGSVALSGGVTPNMDVLIDSLGNLYFSSYTDNVVRKITLVPPAPPINVVAISGMGSLSVSFTPAPTNGGIATTSYTATCGSQSNSGTSSPIVVSGLAAGVAVTCTVRAVSVAGAGQPSAASASTAPLILQSITFTSLPSAANRIFGGSDSIAATGGASGNAVVFSSATNGVCTSGGTNGETLSFVGAGSCTINANQAGNASYAAAPQASTTFGIAQATQTITFVSGPPIANLVFGSSGTLVASGGASGNPVVFSSQTASVCTTTGANGATVNFVGAGTCTIAMNQAASTHYAAATTATVSLSIAKANQTIIFGTPPLLMVGVANTATAATTSGLGVTFTSLTPTICTATGTNGATITASQLGVCTIAADQAGNANYHAAPQVASALGVYLGAVWTVAANMQTGRVWHTATRLQDGRVLVVGGFNGALLASAEIFDPIANTWTAVGNLAIGRRTHTATLLNNGKVLIAGGSAGPFNVVGAAELFDPATNAFTSAGSAVPRQGHQAVLLSDGRAMVMGGEQSDTVDIYDPTTNTWTAAANMPTRRQAFVLSLLPNGNVLVAGGLSNSTITATATIYNPGTNVWSSAASASGAAARFNATGMMLHNGRVLMAGGSGPTGAMAASESYDSLANLWSATGIMSVPRRNHAAALLVNGSVLAVGGGNSFGILDTNDLYNASSNTWSLTANLNTARHLHTATALNDGRVLAAAGENSVGTSINSAELYSPIRFDVLPATATLASGAVGLAYSAVTFGASGGLGSYTYAISSGVLPAGLSLSNAGTLSGTPTAAGTFAFTVAATDAYGYNGIRAYSLSITAGTQAITFGPAPTINLLVNPVVMVSATGGASGNPVVFSVLSGDCVSTGSNGQSISGIDQGTCVIAANQAGNAGYNAAPQVTQNVEVVTTPGVPSIGLATRGNGQATVNFTPPIRNGNSPITGYIATCGSQSVPGSASPIVVTPLSNGVTVTCAVRAVNAIGTGPASAASNAVTPSTVADAPSIVSVTAGNASVSVAFSAPASDGGSSIISYLANCGSQSNNNSGAVAPIDVVGLPNGVPVTCRVLATNVAGDSAWSQASANVTPVGPPEAPSAATATAGNGNITVAFTPPFDNGSPITGYTATCGAVSTSGAASPIVVAGVTNGLSLACTVVATNAVGDSVPSVPSNAVVGAGMWRPAGTMAAARAFHTLTLLADGRVLVAGGADSVGVYPAAAEIYSPASNSWTTSGSLNTPRYDHTATRMSDGRVLIAGGRSASSVTLSSTEIFDPATGQWTAGPSMTFARVGHKAMLLANGKVLFAGGGFNDADLYNPATNTMASGGSDPASRHDASAILMEDGRVLVAGGSQGAFVLASASLYNPVTNTWAATGSMGVARRRAGAVLLPNGSAFVVGGATSTGSSTPTAQTSSYNIDFGVWIPAANLPEPLTSDATLSVLPNGGVLRVAGHNSSTFTNTSITLAYNASANEWVQSSSLITERFNHGAVVLPNGQVLVAGGANNSGVIASPEIRDADGATPPAAPVMGTATAGNAQASVSFSAPASNGGSVVVSYTASCGTANATGAVSPLTVTGLTNGTPVTCSVIATNAIGNSVASPASDSITPQASQTIVFDTAPTLSVGGAGAVSATGGASGNPVLFHSTTTAICTLSGLNGVTVTGVTAGTCTVAANQAGNASYVAAAEVTQSFTIGQGAQVIIFGTAPTIMVGDTGTVSATGGTSGNPVLFTSMTATVCTLSGLNGETVTGLSAGTCSIAANQAGNANYAAAAEVTQSFAIAQGAQVIIFGTAPAIMVGDTGTVSATGGASGNPVQFTSMTTAVCTLSGLNGETVTGLSAGTCSIAANQAGNANYAAAAEVVQSFSVAFQQYTVTPSAGSNGAIDPTAPILVNRNDTAVFTVTPDNGYFATVTGSCGGSLVGDTYTTAAITADCTVEADFSQSATAPGAPQLVSATPLNSAARLVFNAPSSNGGSAILEYLASCTPGAHTGTASSSPIELTGLSNNIAYRCVVRARNAVGSGAVSNALSVIPGASGNSADLSISKTDNATFVNDAEPVVYVIIVNNPGPAAVVGAHVEDALGSDFSSAQWSCAASGGAWCELNGSDFLDLLVDLPAQASVQITLTTQLTAGITTAVSNIASVTPPIGITDPNLNNNVASDGPDARGIFRDAFE